MVFNFKSAAIATAVIFSTTLAAGATTISPSAGLKLGKNHTESSEIQVFSERSDVSVGAGDVTVDYLVGSNLNVGDTVSGVNTFSSGFALAAGTYDSFLVHFDPDVERSAATQSDTKTVEFGQKIIGIILSNGGRLRRC